MSVLGYANLDGGESYCVDCYNKAIEEDKTPRVESFAYDDLAEGWSPIDNYAGEVSIFETCCECGAYLRDDDIADRMREAHGTLCEKGYEYKPVPRVALRSSAIRKAVRDIERIACMSPLAYKLETIFQEM